MRAVNLLPPDLRSGPKGPAPAVASGEKTSGAGAFIVLGVLAFAVLAMAAYVLAGNTVKDRQSQLARATAESTAVSQKATALKPYADFETLVNQRVQTVTDLATSRFDWEQALRDVSRAVPADVTLSNLNGSISTDSGGGGGSLRATTPSASSLRRRSVSSFRLIPGRPSIRSVNRRGPGTSSRTIKRLQRSPMTSSARASPQYCW